jgi:hypothetical protein
MEKTKDKNHIIEAGVIALLTFAGLEVALYKLNHLDYISYFKIGGIVVLISLTVSILVFGKSLFEKGGALRSKTKIECGKFLQFLYHHFAAYFVLYLGTIALLFFTYKGALQHVILLLSAIAGALSLIFSFHLIKHSPLSKIFHELKHKELIHIKKTKLINCFLYSFYKLFGVFVFFTALYAISLYYAASFLLLGVLAGMLSYTIMHHNFLIHHKWTWRLKIYILNFAFILGISSILLYLLRMNYIFGGLIFTFLFAICESIFIHIMKQNYSKRTFLNYLVLALLLTGFLIAALYSNDVFEGHLKVKDSKGGRTETLI